MKNPSNARKGFTLTELLVVIVIIAVLASVSFFVASRMRRAAVESVNLSNMRQLGIGMLSQVAEEGRFFHRSADPRWDRWILPSLGYTDDLPEGRNALSASNSPGLAGLAELFKAPDDTTSPEEEGAYKCSYGVAAWLSNANGYPYGLATKDLGVPLARIKKPEDWFMLIQNYKESNILGKGFNSYAQHGAGMPSDSMLIIFVDGHAEKFPKDLPWSEFRKKHEPDRGD